MTLVFFDLLGAACMLRIFSLWIGLDKANISNKGPFSGLEYIGSWTSPLDHFSSLRPMFCFVVLDSNIFARTQFLRGGPWSLILLLYPPPSAKVLHKLVIRDPIVRSAWTRYICPLESSKGPLRGCQSIIPRTILVLS